MTNFYKKSASSINSRGNIIARADDRSSIQKLHDYIVTIWIFHSTESERRVYYAGIEKIKSYDQDATDLEKLYDYYDLNLWPHTLKKIDELKKKYHVIE